MEQAFNVYLAAWRYAKLKEIFGDDNVDKMVQYFKEDTPEADQKVKEMISNDQLFKLAQMKLVDDAISNVQFSIFESTDYNRKNV